MEHCEQTWNGTAKIGDPTGRKLRLHHLHNNGGNTNTKTLNGKINIGGKSGCSRLFQSHIEIFTGLDASVALLHSPTAGVASHGICERER